jgi:hypothetical protein
MNRKGLFFSVMILFLILAIISFNMMIEDAKIDAKSFDESTAIISISNRFSNIYSQTLSLKKEGYPKQVFQRSLPINYDINNTKKSISVDQKFPTSISLFEETFDTMNFFRIFMEDTNTQNIFDDIKVDVNTPRNSLWSGSKESISFIIDPACYEVITDVNNLMFFKSTSNKCTDQFENSNIKQFLFGITPTSNLDYNTILCNGGVCPNEAYTGTEYYYELTIDDSHCFNCSFTQKTISQNFAYGEDLNIWIGCVGACNSQPVEITHSELDFNINSNGSGVDLNSEIIFEDKINDFFISNLDLMVSGFNGFYKTG